MTPDQKWKDEEARAFMEHIKQLPPDHWASADELADVIKTDPDGVHSIACTCIEHGEPVCIRGADGEFLPHFISSRQDARYWYARTSGELDEMQRMVAIELSILSEQLMGLHDARRRLQQG
jgi:hypothetical protein